MEKETFKPLLKNEITRQTKPAASCCGGAPTGNKEACCKLDEEKKAEGASGCGCNSGSGNEVKGSCC